MTDGGCQSGLLCIDHQCVQPQCASLCDCPQGQFCYFGKCLTDPKMPIYCCSNPGCIPGASCVNRDGSKTVCSEDPTYPCLNACDCGPAHCCKYDATVGHNVCVKDIDDPWLPGGAEILGLSCVFGEDATYCCKAPECLAARLAYKATEGIGVAHFRCFDEDTDSVSNVCGNKRCFYQGDCYGGESCVDIADDTTAAPLTSCSPEGGGCVSNAVAEAVFGWKSSQLLTTCNNELPGMSCSAGWKAGGKYAVQQVLGVGGACGNGICEARETAKTCPQDCSCGDGVCDTTEVGSCTADCGVCGDGACGPFETHKNCPADCPVICGDGSCDAGEVTTCPQDCGCPASPTYADAPIWCGDGVCQAIGDIPENYANCRLDCAISLVTTASTTSVCGGTGTQVTFTYVVTNNIGTTGTCSSVSGSVTDNFGTVGSFSSLASGASVTLTKTATVNSTIANTAVASGTFNDPKNKTASALARATVTTHPCDTTPPTITLTCPGTVNVNSTAYASVNVTDLGSGVATQSAPNGNDPVDTSTVGTKTFIVTATDKAGNTASSSCTYKVIYDFSAGFSPPIADPPAVNAAKAGQTIPVKWQLPDGKGGYVSDLGAVANITFQQTACSDLSAALTSEVTEAASSGAGLHYDATANQFVYNWKTISTMAGNCYVLILKLNDGRQYQADFSLK